MSSRAEQARLRWRCRRGMRELDLMLSGWLEQGFEHASDEQRADFARLLELPDPELERYLLWGARPDDRGLAGLVASIRDSRPGIMSSGA